jgi:SAM-dependent methyltransferase
MPRTVALGRCPACESTSARKKFSSPDHLHGVPGNYHYVECRGCGTVRQDPRVVDEDLHLCYPTAYFTHDAVGRDVSATIPARGSFRDSLRRAILRRPDGTPAEGVSKPMKLLGAALGFVPSIRRRARYGLIDALAGPARAGARCLEVGPGQGLDLLRLKWLGWDPVGLDVDPAAAETARATSGCEVGVGPIRDVDFPDGTFQLIYMNHVLEHLPDLADSLDRCSRLLAPGGRLVAVYPNPGSLGGRTQGHYAPIWDPPRHLVLPTRPGIVGLLRRVGFGAVEVRTTARSAACYRGVAWRYRRGRPGFDRDGGGPTVGDRLFGLCEKILVGAGAHAGEELIVVAYKTGGSR